jgi:hypothetical protein
VGARLGRRSAIVVSILAVLALALPGSAFADYGKDPQIISFVDVNGNPITLADREYANPLTFDILVQSDSGEEVSVSIYDDPCAIVSSSVDDSRPITRTTATIRLTGVGPCTVHASAPGNAGTNPGSRTATFAIRGRQRIVFSGLEVDVRRTVHLSAETLDAFGQPTGLPIRFQSYTPTICDVYLDGNDLWWARGNSAGTCKVVAFQPGTDYWYPAQSDFTDVNVHRLAQTITFPPIAVQMPQQVLSLERRVWASSGLPVSLTASGDCWIEGLTVYSLRVGSCTITATQDGNDQYSSVSVPNHFYIGSVGDRIAALAITQISAGPCGLDNEGYDGSCGSNGDDDPWCALFAGWVWEHAGDIVGLKVSDGLITSGAESFQTGYGKTYGTWRTGNPKVGDAVLFADKNNKIQHVAIVTAVYGDGIIDSVGGNQANSVSPNPRFKDPDGHWQNFLAGWDHIAGYASPVERETKSVVDMTYPMQAGQTVTGTFPVTRELGSDLASTFGVGPFFSDVVLNLYRPDGSLVSATDPGVAFTTLPNSIYVVIARADPGMWRYEITARELDPNGEDIHVWATSTSVATTIASQDADVTQYLQPATFTATVIGSGASGGVQFNLDGSPAGSPVALDGAGQATWTTSALAVGSHTISVNYIGSAAVAPSSAPITHTVVRADQTVTFGALAGKTYGDPDFSVGAAASSGLAVSYGAAGDCTVSGSTVHITGAGSCTITASQAGDGNYNPAPDVAQTFSIAKADQSVVFGSLAGKTYGDPDFALAATASSGLAVSFVAAGDCTVSGSAVHIDNAGSCTITASQPGDRNYNPALDVTRTFAIAKKALTITAGAETKLYSKTLAPAGTEFSVAGIVPGDGVTSVTLTSPGFWAGAQPGSYDIVPSAAVGNRLSNYVITYVKGTLTVNLVAIVGLDSVTMSGKGLVDSYNGGAYTGAAPNNDAIVVSNGPITLSGAGTAIRGDVLSGLASPNSPLPALTAPAVAACSPYSSAAGLSGTYTYSAATGDLSVSGNKTVTLANGTYCFNSITISGNAKLMVNGPVVIKLTGRLNASGGGLVNLTNNATNLQISSSFAGSAGVSLSGGANAYLTLYAPATGVVLAGGTQIEGLILGKSITVSGGSAIHQDTTATGVWAGYYRN